MSLKGGLSPLTKNTLTYSIEMSKITIYKTHFTVDLKKYMWFDCKTQPLFIAFRSPDIIIRDLSQIHHHSAPYHAGHLALLSVFHSLCHL